VSATPKQSVELAPSRFPSLAWFEHLVRLMNADRARQEQLGYVDCVAGFRITDAAGATRFEIEVTFEEFSATGVRDVTQGGSKADFVLVATFDTWREMIESIAAGHGRPDLEHSLNRLSHMGTPMRLTGDDVLKTDYYFRYAQSLQEFFNASARFDTRFD